MLIVPGFNSHSAYFDWAAEQLASLGIASFGVDLRGRGNPMTSAIMSKPSTSISAMSKV